MVAIEKYYIFHLEATVSLTSFSLVL